ncbi:MAG: hypothetical protein A3D65_03490 [Candidatus Lloydbacteria bacterium RIFCSPHIGHO2_02_FULL_50_13]|uniref:Uncharacterized protein n=1 Tax=Candidatus Lloydbacteria bacterium RIFCSPHIGHO2_02_FULL_50_13 TaxID=1798661 RepID=A0A1G2D8D3_9BACT|nr:MAG: hypothetical protein A3D65_03490 [Candidatus Lloydbacteria bacterium RIFCSPHIGHO2_02_FULL_50_13]
MENTNHKATPTRGKESPYIIPIAVVIAGAMISGALIANTLDPSQKTVTTEELKSPGGSHESYSASDGIVLPLSGVMLPVSWGNLGQQLIAAGAIDGERFAALYEKRGQFSDTERNLLFGNANGKITLTEDNAGYLLNLFWALGLANQNPILDSGEMIDPRYGGAKNFASTAGWTMAKGNPMDHYSRHRFFTLTPEQQVLVEKISKGIYRPCCGNSTHFPDCNHGMAMLGFLELMASQGVSEGDMWKAALAVNSYWFPDTYITIAAYMKKKGVEWKDISPQEMLGAAYSSASGYAKISAQVARPKQSSGGSGCGVESGESVAPKRQQSGCGI